MNIVKKNHISLFWIVPWLLSIFFVIRSYKFYMMGQEIPLYDLYEMMFGEIFLIGFMIPIYILLILKSQKKYMSYFMVLRAKNRKQWGQKIFEEVLKNSILFIFIIQVPTYGMIVFMSKSATDLIYGLLSLIIYILYFYFIGILSIVIRIKMKSDIVPIISMICVSFLPHILKALFPQYEIKQLPEILNAYYFIGENGYHILGHQLVIIGGIFFLFVVRNLVECWMKKIDLLWREV